MREPRLCSSPSIFHPSTNRRMYIFASSGEMGEPCGMPRRLSRASALGELAQKSETAKALRYALRHWDGLTLYLDDGRIEMDTNAVERAMRPIKLNAKNALFAGCDEGAENWALLASLIETALCRVRHNAVYADCRTMPNGFEKNPSFARTCGWSSGCRPGSIRHNLASYSASRKASRRSLGWKRVRLRCAYGLSFARAASLSARWACR